MFHRRRDGPVPLPHRQPPRYTVLEVLWRALAPVLLRLRPFHEVWAPAQHDTRATHLLAVLNDAAHAQATSGANSPQAWAVPLAPLRGPRVLLYYMGALVLDPHKGLDAAYDQAAADTYFTGSRRDLRRPSASEFTALVEDAAVPALAIKRAYAYRVLEWQTPPNRQQPMECHFCGTVWRDLHHHVRGRCPAAYARLLHAQALFFRHVPREPTAPRPGRSPSRPYGAPGCCCTTWAPSC